MSTLPGSYNPKEVEKKWYQSWKEKGLFKANPSSKKPAYTIVIPPPNVTGVLHVGHALVNTVQDTLIRWKRMSGYEALWVPGTDHAGIATQTVVERHLMATMGKRRKEFPREEFLSHVWAWKEKSQHRILEQLEGIGCSLDWDRLRFTMDDDNNKAVRLVFKKMFDEGLIYRGDYLVNWDTITQTALADDEVDYEERSTFLWHFRYPLEEGGHIEIATTRPETMLGDTAVAVSPSDERYKHLIGKKIKLPLSERLIPIIADHRVDEAFGTGCVKITPAHDPNDYQMGLEHNLPFINIMTPDGFINEQGGAFQGLSMLEGREKVIVAMKEQGFFVKQVPHTNRVGLSYRSKAVIEPYMSKQWFVKMDGFAVKLKNFVDSKEFRLIPEQLHQTYLHWVGNLRDWCISRQLWWGHRIPVWYNKSNPEQIICYAGEGLPPEVQTNPSEWYQDEDVLDTWFSSALWPFSVLGWPHKTAEMEKFYPTSVLVTAQDILFFWVARMLFMGEYLTGKIPFPESYLHGLIYGKSYWRQKAEGGISYVSEEERLAFDLGEKELPKDVFSKWEKMSKSKGNVADPMEIIETYGTDAMRMALLSSCTHTPQIDLDRRRFEEFKNFTNKIWNGSRFILMNLEGNPEQGVSEFSGSGLSKGLRLDLLKLEDRWILSKLDMAVREVTGYLTSYQFDQATTRAYDFFWKEFCAYYLEIVKPVLFGKEGDSAERENKQKLLTIILLQSLRLLHPIAPFITEEVFQHLKEALGDVTSFDDSIDLYTKDALLALQQTSVMVASYPISMRSPEENQAALWEFECVEQVVYTIRNIRGEMRLPPATKIDLTLIGQQDLKTDLVFSNLAILKSLIRIGEISCTAQEQPMQGLFSTGVVGGIKIIIPLPQELREQEKKRLIKEEERLSKMIAQIEGQLQNEQFCARAPKELIQKQESSLQNAKIELSSIKEKLLSFM